MLLFDETVNLWLQRKIAPWVQLIHALDFEELQLILDTIKVSRQFLDCFFKVFACWLRRMHSFLENEIPHSVMAARLEQTF